MLTVADAIFDYNNTVLRGALDANKVRIGVIMMFSRSLLQRYGL